MARTPTTPLANSAHPLAGSHGATTPLPGDETVSLTVHVAESDTQLPDTQNLFLQALKAEFGKALGQQVAGLPDDLTALSDYLGEHGLTVTHQRDNLGQLQVTGPASAVEAAFGVTLVTVDDDGKSRRTWEGEVHLPAELKDKVQGVVGLDDLTLARSRTHEAFQVGINPDPYTPQELAERYGFPPESDGTGRRIALVLLEGGFYQSDMDTYFPSMGLEVPKITVIGTNAPAPYDDAGTVVSAYAGGTMPSVGDITDAVTWTIETTMDMQVAGALANGAELIVAFADSNSIDGATQVLSKLLELDPVPDVVSMSWSFDEGTRSATDLAALDRVLKALAAAGATVCACTGDYGSSGQAKNIASGTLAVVYPASSHYALACGGTSLPRKADESVWNTTAGEGAAAAFKMAGGGGFSAIYDQPSWQTSAAESYGSTMRGLPDVSADADPTTGMHVLIAGKDYVSAGTSAATPTWAALAARLDGALDTSLGLLAPHLYPLAGDSALDAVESGSNALSTQTDDYGARSGWSPAAGLGSPNGTALLAALKEQLAADESS